jgi:ABC-type sugar transport system ATPase subunit
MEHVARALGGIVRHRGRVRLRGRDIDISHPVSARRAGIALVPEDRRRQALFPALSVADNICLPVLYSLQRLAMIGGGTKLAFADAVMERLSVRPRGAARQVRFFSGGNQQKVVIGKWMSARASVYVFVEPTSGVDIGAIKEIYDIILHLAREGAAVIVVSSSLREILALSDRVLVIHDGALVGEAPKADWSYDELLAATMQGKHRRAA